MFGRRRTWLLNWNSLREWSYRKKGRKKEEEEEEEEKRRRKERRSSDLEWKT